MLNRQRTVARKKADEVLLITYLHDIRKNRFVVEIEPQPAEGGGFLASIPFELSHRKERKVF